MILLECENTPLETGDLVGLLHGGPEWVGVVEGAVVNLESPLIKVIVTWASPVRSVGAVSPSYLWRRKRGCDRGEPSEVAGT